MGSNDEFSTDESFEKSKYYRIGGIHVPFYEDGAARIRFEKVFNQPLF